jgi:anti-sigma B factor antagonist
MQEKFSYEDGYDVVTRVIVCGGELDGTCADAIREHVEKALIAGKRRVIIDLSQTTFIESSALGALNDANARIKRFGASLSVVVPKTSELRRLFVITHLDKVLQIAESREEALAA